MTVAHKLESMPDAPQDWVRADHAAELTGESIWTWRRRARLEAVAANKGRRQARAVQAGNGKGRPTWWVHRSMDSGLTRYPTKPTREDRAREALAAKYPKHQVERAYQRARWLRAWREACRRRRGVSELELAAEISVEARRVEGEDFRISLRTLQAWHRRYQRLGPDRTIAGVEGLIDKRTAGNRLSGYDGEGVDPLPSSRDPKAIEYFYRLWHTEGKWGVKLCHELTLAEAQRQGWAWAPSYSSTVKWLKACDNRSTSCLMRQGVDRWSRQFLPYLELDYRAIEPGRMFQTDHHQCDFWVEHEGKQLRPWLTAVQDMRSRAIVGWNLGPTPHQDAILAAYSMAFRDWAIPEAIRIDNGRDYTSKLFAGRTKAERLRDDLVDCDDPAFAGIAEELGIRLIFAIPYAAWSKGTTERWFGTFEERCGKLFTTYCGNSALTKPECLETIRRGYTKEQKRYYRKRYGKEWKRVAVLKLVDTSDVPTMDQAREDVAGFIAEYNNRAHSADDMGGRTPLEVWHTAKSLRKADDDALLLLMRTRGVYSVAKNGVTLTVGGARVSYGGNDPCLYRFAGRKVVITVDPNDFSRCAAWTPDRERRQFIGWLRANERMEPLTNADDLREAAARVGRRRKIMHQAARDSAKRTRTAVAEARANKQQATALRATGTEGRRPRLTTVRTGFEGVSIGEPGPTWPQEEQEELAAFEDLFLDMPEVDDEDDEDEEDLDCLFADKVTDGAVTDGRGHGGPFSVEEQVP